MLASTLTASLTADGLLSIQGTASNDVIDVRQTADAISVQGITIKTPGGQAAAVGADAVKRMNIASLGGADTIRLDRGSQTLAETVSLAVGPGTDTLYSGGTARAAITLTSVVKTQRAPDGTVFWMQTDTTLNTSAGSWASAAGGELWRWARDFEVAPDSSVYVLATSGAFHYRRDGSWAKIDSRMVTRMEINPVNGALWTLGTDGWLSVNGVRGWANTKDFALGLDGSFYKLDRIALHHVYVFPTCKLDYSLQGVTKFQFSLADNSLWTLDSGGNLRSDGSTVAAATRDFSLASDGALYRLDSAGALTYVVSGGGVAAVGAATTTYTTTVRQIRVLSGVNGLLYAIPPAGTPLNGGTRTIASSVAKFDLQPADESVWSLTSSGSLAVNGTARWSKVKDFAMGSDGMVYRLDTNSQLFWMRGDSSYWNLVSGGYGSIPLRPDESIDVGISAYGTSGLYIVPVDVEYLRLYPERIGAVFQVYKPLLRKALGSEFQAVTDEGLLAIFATMAAYQLVPYGAFAPYGDLSVGSLVVSPGISCALYVQLAAQLFRLADADPTTGAQLFQVGFLSGAVGNHAQLFVSGAGIPLLLDPTTGLIARTELSGLFKGTPIASSRIKVVALPQPYRVELAMALKSSWMQIRNVWMQGGFRSTRTTSGWALNTDYYFIDLATMARTGGAEPQPAIVARSNTDLYILGTGAIASIKTTDPALIGWLPAIPTSRYVSYPQGIAGYSCGSLTSPRWLVVGLDRKIVYFNSDDPATWV